MGRRNPPHFAFVSSACGGYSPKCTALIPLVCYRSRDGWHHSGLWHWSSSSGHAFDVYVFNKWATNWDLEFYGE